MRANACLFHSMCSVAQSYLTLRDPLDCSLPGVSVHGIFQARILEWISISNSRVSSRPRDRTHISCLLHWQAEFLSLHHLGSSSFRHHSSFIQCSLSFLAQRKSSFSDGWMDEWMTSLGDSHWNKGQIKDTDVRIRFVDPFNQMSLC